MAPTAFVGSVRLEPGTADITVIAELTDAIAAANRALSETLWDTISRMVDRVYAPFGGAKTATALKDIEWLIICNQPSSKMDRMIEAGMTTKDEIWKVYCYLMQCRKELMGLGHESVYPSFINDAETVAAACR